MNDEEEFKQIIDSLNKKQGQDELVELKKEIIVSLIAAISVAKKYIKSIADSKDKLSVLITLEVTTRYLENLVKYFKSIHKRYLSAPIFQFERQEDSQE